MTQQPNAMSIFGLFPFPGLFPYPFLHRLPQLQQVWVLPWPYPPPIARPNLTNLVKSMYELYFLLLIALSKKLDFSLAWILWIKSLFPKMDVIGDAIEWHIWFGERWRAVRSNHWRESHIWDGFDPCRCADPSMTRQKVSLRPSRQQYSTYTVTLTFLRCAFMVASTPTTVPLTAVPFFNSIVTISRFSFCRNLTNFIVKINTGPR